MTAITYKSLALGWQPAQEETRNFHRIVTVVFLFAIILLCIIAYIEAPEKSSRAHKVVPDRIAEFISRKEKPIPPPKQEIKPTPKPQEVEIPVVVPEPEVEAIIEPTPIKEADRKPLTDSQKEARKVAAKSGLLALANELNDLIDTKASQVNASKKLSTANSNNTANTNDYTVAAGHDDSAITAGIAQSGGHVDSGQYTNAVGETELETRKAEKVTGELLANVKKDNGNTPTKGHSGGANAGEDVTIIFEKNKGGLYSLYERERRTTPGLQGKIVLQLIISPEGDVIDVKIISSELNNPALEAKLISRIKLFKFNAGGSKPMTITYPIEFLPS